MCCSARSGGEPDKSTLMRCPSFSVKRSAYIVLEKISSHTTRACAHRPNRETGLLLILYQNTFLVLSLISTSFYGSVSFLPQESQAALMDPALPRSLNPRSHPPVCPRMGLHHRIFSQMHLPQLPPWVRRRSCLLNTVMMPRWTRLIDGSGCFVSKWTVPAAV